MGFTRAPPAIVLAEQPFYPMGLVGRAVLKSSSGQVSPFFLHFRRYSRSQNALVPISSVRAMHSTKSFSRSSELSACFQERTSSLSRPHAMQRPCLSLQMSMQGDGILPLLSFLPNRSFHLDETGRTSLEVPASGTPELAVP